jgi:hypothetical protein
VRSTLSVASGSSSARWRTSVDWISKESWDLVIILVFLKGLCACLTPISVCLGISLYASVYGFNLSNLSMFYQKKKTSVWRP